MKFSFSGFFYQILIDPILARLHDSVLMNIESSSHVIDVACGTGSQAIAIARKARHVTALDLSEDMIGTATRSAQREGIENINFLLHDASDLSAYNTHEFDIAVTSMAIHQYEADLAVAILGEMKRIASKVIILDYNYPMPKGLSRSIAFGIERFAGGDHYRNFMTFNKKEGIRWFLDKSGLTVKSTLVRGNGVFQIVVCR